MNFRVVRFLIMYPGILTNEKTTQEVLTLRLNSKTCSFS